MTVVPKSMDPDHWIEHVCPLPMAIFSGFTLGAQMVKAMPRRSQLGVHRWTCIILYRLCGNWRRRHRRSCDRWIRKSLPAQAGSRPDSYRSDNVNISPNGK